MNNNGWDVSLRVMMTLGFFAIWFITELFNRNAKKQASQKAAPRYTPRPPAASPRNEGPTMRWGGGGGGGGAGGRTPPAPLPGTTRKVVLGEDDILIVSNENDRAPRSPFRQVSRKPSKSRQPQPQKKVENTATKPKLGGVSQSVSQQISKSLDIKPLETGPSATSRPAKLVSPVGLATTGLGDAIAAQLRDPARLREAFILNEVLQKPVAMRSPSPRRR